MNQQNQLKQDDVAGGAKKPNQTGGQSKQGDRRGRYGRNNGRGGRNNDGAYRKSSFRGETPGLNGNVFQTQGESRDPTQFKRTMEALERFSNKVYQVDIRTLFGEDIALPVLVRPIRPSTTSTGTDELELEEYKEEVKEFVKDRKCLRKTLRSLFSVIWGQCSTSVTTRLLAIEELPGWKEEGLCDELLKSIRQVMMHHEHQKCAYVTLFRELRQFYAYKQKDNQTLHQYFEVFQIMVDNIKRYGGNFGDQHTFINEMMSRDNLSYDDVNVSESVRKDYEEKARSKFLATAFLLGGRMDLYGDLCTELENDFLKGRDFFPDSTTEAYNLMTNYVQRKGARNNTDRAYLRQNGLGFLQTNKKNDIVPGTDGIVHEKIKCYTCERKGHYSDKCPVSLFQDASKSTQEQDTGAGQRGNDVDAQESDVMHDQMGFGFMQLSLSMLQANGRYDGLDKNWVLLDTQSNCDIFKNSELLQNVREYEGQGGLTLHSNGGTLKANMIGDIPGYGTVWLNEQSLANILSFANVRKRCRITLQTGPNDPSPTIVVHRSSGVPMLFREHSLGLYVHDTSNLKLQSNKVMAQQNDYSFLSTMKQLEANFTPKELERAKAVDSLNRKLGYPSAAVLRDTIENRNINGCDLDLNDFKRYIFLFGSRTEPMLKGKTTRKNPSPVQDANLIPLPESVLAWHSNVTIFIDIFFVQGLPFFHSISKSLNFRTVESMVSTASPKLLECLQNIINIYNARGFDVTHVHGDREFASLGPSILPTILYMCGSGDHIPTVERSIRTVKERCRCVIHGLPYTHYTTIMIRSLVYFVVNRLNSFPCNPGCVPDMTPTNLVTGLPTPSMRELSIEFGAYVQVHDNLDNTRTTMARTTGAISLMPANRAGAWFFMSLSTGKRITRSRWTPCTITNDVILRIQDLVEHPIHKDKLQRDFEGASVMPMEPNEEDIQIQDADTTVEEEERNPSLAGVAEAQEDQPLENQVNENEAANHDVADDANDDGDEHRITDTEESDDEVVTERSNNDERAITHDFEDNVEAEPAETQTEIASDEATELNQHNESETITSDNSTNESEAIRSDNVANAPREEADEADEPEDSSQPPQIENEIPRNEQGKGIRRAMHSYNLRKKIQRTKDNRFNTKAFSYLQMKREKYNEKEKARTLDEMYDIVWSTMEATRSNKTASSDDIHHALVGMCMTQMHAKKGIRVYGDRALKAMSEEYSQLESLGVFQPIHTRTLNVDQRRSALNVIDLIKEKRCGRIKGRTVVDGRGQRGTYSKAETSSSALTLEAFVATLAVDAVETRDVATADIAGAYLKADQPDHVMIKMRGPAVQAILRVDNKKYAPYVSKERGEEVLYMKLLKAMYGTLTAALLWYQMFARTLVSIGFKINRYDTCVANKMINGSQFTICWYVDDLKLSHVDNREVTKMLDILKDKFDKLTITRGKRHTYLGINFNIVNKKVHMEMQSYLKECIMSYGESITSAATSPATKGLMNVTESELLDNDRREKFHHIVQKMLHICKRTRLDLQVSIGFLCTRVKSPTLQDWKKLRRVLQYVHGTMSLIRIVSITNFERMDIYIDASHGAHDDFRGQTGGCITMGDGILHGRSSKQTLNSKSSTESELIGVSDYMPYPIWLINFYGDQGYKIVKTVLQQDNESTIKMLTNGRKSCGQRSRHIGIRYFWITDRLRMMKAEIEHCPTTRMLGDFFTKPLQGKLFRVMRDVVHGIKPYSTLMDLESSEIDDIKITIPAPTERIKEGVVPQKCFESGEAVSTDREERVGKDKKKEDKRVKFIDGVENAINVAKRRRTYADVAKGSYE